MPGGPQALAQNLSKLNELKGLLDEPQQRYEVLIVLPEERVLFDRFKTSEQKYLQFQAQMMTLSAQGQVEEAAAILNGEMSPLADEITVTMLTWRRRRDARCSARRGSGSG